MPKIDQSVINFDVYEDATEYYGMASVTMPTVTNLVSSISGAGIAGNIEAVILGHIDAMSMTLTFRTLTDASIRLAEQRRHNIELRVAQQTEDTTTGAIDVNAIKHVVVVKPKVLNLGNVAPAAAADVSGEYAVSYLATVIDGKKVLEIDPLNYIYHVNGVDYLVNVRKALGK